MTDKSQPAYIFKICLLGAGAVGKTCIARTLCFNTFDANTKLTIGIDFYTYELPILIKKEESFIRLSVWDFGGQEQFKRLFTYYIKGANGIFMTFDLTNLQSLLNLDWWYERVAEENAFDCPRIILGTKEDLVKEIDDKSKVDELVIKQFMNRHNEKDFVKTSAKENVNILQSVKQMVEKILEEHQLTYDRLL